MLIAATRLRKDEALARRCDQVDLDACTLKVAATFRRVDLDGDELNLTMWDHDLDRLQSASDYWGRAVWKLRYRVLNLPGLFGYVFNMAALGEDAPAECLVERLHRF